MIHKVQKYISNKPMNFSKYFEAYPVHGYMNVVDTNNPSSICFSKDTAISGSTRANMNLENLYLILATSISYL